MPLPTDHRPPPLRRTAATAAAVLLLVALGAPSALGKDRVVGLGTRLAALGDLDGDGNAEFASGTRSGRETIVFSAAAKRELWRARAHAAAPVPDRDGDGRDDVVLAVGPGAEWAHVVRGLDGERLAVVTPKWKEGAAVESDGKRFSASVAVLGDVDGDGRPELLVVRASPPGGFGGDAWCTDAAAYVVGLDGSVLADLGAVADPGFRTPLALPAGDADGDGKPDVLVWCDVKRPWMPVERRSAAGETRQRFKGSDDFPDAAVFVGDTNGDGTSDLVVGSSRAGGTRKFAAGAVAVLSGKNGAVLRTTKSRDAGARLGRAVVALPDLDGDQVPDFAAGSPGACTKKGVPTGAVVAYSGKTGKVVWTAEAESADDLGESLAVLTDLDGDGVVDLAAGAPNNLPELDGRVVLLSGKTGKVLHVFTGN